MSVRSQRRKLQDGRRYELAQMYWHRYSVWANREPSRWRIFAWLKWKRERPFIPKWVEEYDALREKYYRHHMGF